MLPPVTPALPYDVWSVAAIVAAAICFVVAVQRSRSVRARLAAIAVAALILRLDPSWQESLHHWDESVHAVVASNLIAHPLTPTLYESRLLTAAPGDWAEAHVWLHKPPLALWLMAASLALFDVSALAARLPSVVLSTCGVVLTFLIGRRAFGDRVGLLAATFQAVNGLLVSLAAGRRVADHVDTTLITCVQLSVWLALSATGDDARRDTRRAALAGAAMGAGLLAKSFPALIALVVAAIAWFAMDDVRRAGRKLGVLVAAAVAVAGPWAIYTRIRFPAEAQHTLQYTLRHITEVLEGHGGASWSYVSAMPHYFGELVYVPAALFLYNVVRRPQASTRAIAAWLVLTYVTFSLMATKLTAFVAIAAPALFLAQAHTWIWLRDIAAASRRPRRLALAVLLGLLILLPARYLLEPTGPLERRDRTQALTRQFMTLDHSLGVPQAVIFNVPRPYELMFYSRHEAYGRMPNRDEVAELHRRGIPIYLYQPAGTIITPPAEWQARILEGR